jgi:phage-related protein (TIGR01555 family)
VKVLDSVKTWLWGKNPEVRFDGWENSVTGYGTWRDKLTYGHHAFSAQISDSELSTLFYSDDVAAKLIEKRPEEAFRRGYKLIVKNSDVLEAKAKALGLDAKIQEAIKWGRLWGGCLLIIGAEQGSPTAPLDETKVRDVRFLNVVDRRFAYVERSYTDPLAPKYGEPEIYRINGINGTVSYVHESRVIRFDGVATDPMKRLELGGWSYSVLQRPYDVMRTFATAFQAAGILTADASQAVFKMKGLFEMIASGEKERLQTRMQLVDMQRSSARAVLLDSDGEDFQRIKTDFTGYPEMLDRMMMRLASSIDMPVTILMGRSPAGQNATGDSDFQHWYDSIKSQQTKELTPKLLRIYSILAQGKLGDAEIEWCDLNEPTDAERADTELKQAERDAIYIDKGVVIPEQVAVAGSARATAVSRSTSRRCSRASVSRRRSPACSRRPAGLSARRSSQRSRSPRACPRSSSRRLSRRQALPRPTLPARRASSPRRRKRPRMPSQTLRLAKSRAAARSLSTAIDPIERRYVRALRSVAADVAAEYMRALKPFVAARADAASRTLPSTFDVLGLQVQAAVEGTVGPLFDRHAKDVLVANARAMKLLGIRLAPDHRVGFEIQERRKANIDLVVNAQRAYAQSVKDIFESPENVGLRVEELQAMLLERGSVSESRAELIARDQTLKLNGAITEIRQTNAGVTEYTWSTSQDERVREEHAALEGQTFAWSSPPAVGHPGEDFQCRCVALPVIDELKEGLTPPEDPKAPEPAPVEPKPEPAKLEAGKHFEKFKGDVSDEVVRAALGSVSDSETLAFLEREPLKALEIKKQAKTPRGVKVNGLLFFKDRRLVVTGERMAGTFGTPFEAGKSWSISSTATTKEAAVAATLRHELGHHVHMFDGRQSAADVIVQNAYVRARAAGVSVTKYAGQSRDEYFAENYAAYYLRNAELKAHDPNGFAMVEQVLELRGIKK